MKKFIKNTFTLLSFGLFLSCNTENSSGPIVLENFEDKSTEVEVSAGMNEVSIPPQQVSSPPLPPVVTFAGDTVPLHREDVKEALESELIVNTFRHSRTLSIIKSIERWRPLIESTLQANQVPVDFIYLAVAESEFDNNALSYAGAMGMWQFMENTAKEYKLDVNRSVDMRRDPKLSTEAASQYLKKSYTSLENWTLAAAAYNRGITGIRNNLKDQQVVNFYDLHLNPETARYVYRIIAFKLILENPQAYGYFLKPEDIYKPYDFSVETVEEDVDDLVEYAKTFNTTYKELRILNPWFNNTSNYKLDVPRNSSYEIRIPALTTTHSASQTAE